MKLRVFSYLNAVSAHVNYDRDSKYVIISCQDGKGFGFNLLPTEKCLDVLTLYFDDADTINKTFCSHGIPEEEFAALEAKSCLFSDEQARQVVEFVEKYKDQVDEIWVHCYAGRSRSQAVAAAISKFYTGDDDRYFQMATPNMRVYRKVLEEFHNQA